MEARWVQRRGSLKGKVLRMLRIDGYFALPSIAQEDLHVNALDSVDCQKAAEAALLEVEIKKAEALAEKSKYLLIR